MTTLAETLIEHLLDTRPTTPEQIAVHRLARQIAVPIAEAYDEALKAPDAAVRAVRVHKLLLTIVAVTTISTTAPASRAKARAASLQIFDGLLRAAGERADGATAGKGLLDV